MLKAALDVTTSVATKPQVVMPEAALDYLHWKPGDRLVVEEEDGRLVLRLEPLFQLTRIEDVVGCLKYEGPPETVRQMDEAVDEYFRSRGRS